MRGHHDNGKRRSDSPMKRLFFASVAMAILAGSVNAATGREIYIKKCQTCHGPDGKGNKALTKVYGPNLNIADPDTLLTSDDELRRITRLGAVQGKMPAYKKSLTEEQITEVIAYIRELGPKEDLTPSLDD